jgi:hypothetical protein
LAEELGNLERQAGYRAGLALAARGQGDTATALAYLDEAMALSGSQGYWHLQTRLLLWQLETRLMHGQAAGELLEAAAAAAATAEAHDHVLLLIQAERLCASLLARAGDWPAAEARFADALNRAAALDLPFEAARTQAARAALALHHAPAGDPAWLAGELRQAQARLEAYDARGDLASLARWHILTPM